MINGRVRFVEQLARVEHILVAYRGVDADGVPLVTVADVLELVETWTVVVGDSLKVDDSLDEVAPHWDDFATRARSIAARRAADDYYPDRRGVLASLRLLAVLADQVDAGRISEAFAAGWRNAAVSASGSNELDITDVKDWVDLLGAVARHLRETRGVVTEASPPPGRAAREFPKTTVAEVLAIADFWTQRLAELGRRQEDTDAAIAAWRRVVADAANSVKSLALDSAYPKDWEFWDTLYALVPVIDRARTVAVPPRWHVRLGAASSEPSAGANIIQSAMHEIEDVAHAVVEGVENAASAAMRTVQGTVQGVQSAATSAFQGVVESVEGAARSAVRDAARGVAADAASEAKEALARLAKPVAIGGAALVGALILVPALLRHH